MGPGPVYLSAVFDLWAWFQRLVDKIVKDFQDAMSGKAVEGRGKIGAGNGRLAKNEGASGSEGQAGSEKGDKDGNSSENEKVHRKKKGSKGGSKWNKHTQRRAGGSWDKKRKHDSWKPHNT